MSGLPFLLLVVGSVAVLTPVLGRYLHQVLDPRKPSRLFDPIERGIFRVCAVDSDGEQRWSTYLASVLALGAVSLVLLYAILRLQGVLPLNPTTRAGVEPALAFNVAASFVSNTNWQNYGGEATLSHLSQMAGLGVQNFVSAGVGLAVMAAFLRGLARHRADTIGNFWVDLTRVTVRLLLPASLLFAFVLVSDGVVQNFEGFTEVTTLEGGSQMIPGGPAASQVAIKQLGTNGGGFFNTNSSHPFENPGPVSNLVSTVALVLIPFATVDTFGRMVKSRRDAYAVMAAMAVLWLASVGLAMYFESGSTPALDQTVVQVEPTVDAPGGNLEGKETRLGSQLSAVWAASTTATSNGSVNSMHDSYTGWGGMVALGNILLGEVSPGGVGVGLTGMLIAALLTVFLAGLMVGRTPEYLGKKIQAAEVSLVAIYFLTVPLLVLGFSAISVVTPGGMDAQGNPGPHGFTELLYAFASPANNNGSAFAGFASNTPWYNLTQAAAMLSGRYVLIMAVLAIGGSLSRKPRVEPGIETFPTGTPLFVGLLLAVIVIVTGLTYFPALVLGPIAEGLS